MTLTFTVVFVSLSLCVIAQPILNNNGDDASHKDVLAVVSITNVRNENSRNKANPALIQLVVDNDEARKKWFQRREQSLHGSLNGANGHFVKGKDDNEADASAIPPQESAPVATPEQLLALLEKKKGSVSTKSDHVRVIRQVLNSEYQVAPTIGGYPSPYVYQPQLNFYTSTVPPPTEAPKSTTSKPEESSVATEIQSARDEYRKNRFAGSAYALALRLSKAGNTPLSEGSSYSG